MTRRGTRSGVLGAASAWLVEPAGPARQPSPGAPAGPRRVVAVFGLARRCGATVVARALATALAARDPGGSAAVAGGVSGAGLPIAGRTALRLCRVLADVPGASTRAAGRLCLVGGADALALADTARHHAPLVLDAGAVAVGGVASAVADAVVLVSTPRLEPSLAAVVADGVARVGPEPLVVINRAGPDAPVPRGAALALPESRVAARMALAGQAPGGAFGRGLGALAACCEGGA